MMKHHITLVAVCLVLFSTSCKKHVENNQISVRFQTIKLNDQQTLKNIPGQPTMDIQYEFCVAKAYSNDSILRKIQTCMLKDFLPDAADTIKNPESFLKSSIQKRFRYFNSPDNIAASDESESKPEIKSNAQKSKNWWEKTQMIVRFNADGLLSYTVRSDQFTGDVRPHISIQNTIIDLQTGEKLGEEDLFSEQAIPILHQLIVKTLEQKHRVKTPEELEQIGYFDISEIGQFSNCCLSKKGIVFTYNVSEIGSYDLGAIDVELSYEDLKDLIAPSSPLNRIY